MTTTVRALLLFSLLAAGCSSGAERGAEWQVGGNGFVINVRDGRVYGITSNGLLYLGSPAEADAKRAEEQAKAAAKPTGKGITVNIRELLEESGNGSNQRAPKQAD